MKVPLSWLREYVPFSAAPPELAGIFTQLGFEVEGISGGFTPAPGLVVGRVLESKKHPNADTLSVNKVDVGSEVLDIVCGAKNVRAGLTVALIQAGFSLPNGMAIKKTKIRGEVSNGMICSEAELGIAGSSEGILELPGEFPPGEPLGPHHLGAEVVLDVAVLSNRPDALSLTGLARELAAKTGVRPSFPNIAAPAATPTHQGKVRVSVSDSAACPRYSARLITGVRIGPSPTWLAHRLKAAGVRPINNVVDVTNYVLLELGHPLHAFDARQVAGLEIRVRKAAAGEPFRTLDGREHALSADDLLICDRDKPIALAGVMGGENSVISESTTGLVLESAYFEPVGIRRTSRRLGILSESSYRFERGADPEGAPAALDRATALILELAGGAAGERVEHYPHPVPARRFPVRCARINRLLATALPAGEITNILGSLGFRCGPGDPFEITVPTFRHDVAHEADLAEEVARLRGYDTVEPAARVVLELSAAPDPREAFRAAIRRYLSGKGLREAVTPSLCSPRRLEILGEGERPVRLKNPLSPDFSVLRTTLFPSLLDVVRWNLHHNTSDVRVFELGKTFVNEGADRLPREFEMLGCAFTGRRLPLQWGGEAGSFDLPWVRGLAESLLASFCVGVVQTVPAEAYGCRGLSVALDGRPLGRVLPVSPRLAREFELKEAVYYLEFDAGMLFDRRVQSVRYKAPSKFPPVDRDLAVVVEGSAPVDRMAELLRAQSPLIEEVRVFDIFKSEELGPSKKSVAFFLRMRKGEATLTDAEAEAVVAKALGALEKEFGAKLRS